VRPIFNVIEDEVDDLNGEERGLGGKEIADSEDI